jgi:Lipocalin-like domain
MNRRNLLALYALALCTATTTTSGAMAQQKSLKEQLVGNWTFVSSIDTNRDGTKTDRFGPNAKGLVMFDASGRFSFLISRASIPKFAANNVNQGTAEENKSVVQGMIAYFGTWSVDETSRTLTTNIEAGSFPNLNGGSQKRNITSLTADELKYTNPATTTGTSSDVVWRRAK